MSSSSASLASTPARYRTVIPPVPPGVPRPRWSVMIPTYHCARYLRQTLESVLTQDPGPEHMQIEVIDDHSTADDPEAVVRDVGRGRIGFFRQPANVGHIRNFDTCLTRSRGELVHLLHGDDRVLHGFYQTMERPFLTHPEIGAAFSRYVAMDQDDVWHTIAPVLQRESGVIEDWLGLIAAGQRLQPPTKVVRRSVYEHLGGFDQRVAEYGEDWEMWVRIAAAYPVWHHVEPLAVYRTQTGSLTGRSMRTGQNMRDMRTVIALNAAHLPTERRAAITRQALRANALGAIRRAHRVIGRGDMETPLVQIREALRTSRAPEVALRAGVLFGHWSVMRVLRAVGLARPRR